MPIFTLYTNVPKSKIPPNFLAETSNLVARTVQKSNQYVIVHIIPDQMMVMGGTNDPCGYASLLCVGQLGVEENKNHSNVLYTHIEKHLGIPKDRFYIIYKDADRAAIGYDGTTFHEIFGTNEYVIVHIIPDQMMVMGGTTDPCGYASLLCVGQLGVEENKKHSNVLYTHIEKHLGIPKDRFYIIYEDGDRAAIGYKGTTFHEIFGANEVCQ